MKKKWKIIRFILLGIILAGGIVGLIIVNKKIDQRRINSFTVIKNKGRYEIGFDAFIKESGKLNIGGWCFKINNSYVFDLRQNIIVQVVLRNKNDNKDIYFLDTKRCQRDELDEMFPYQTTRKYYGFTADISLDKLDLDKNDYDIYMFYNTVDGNKDVFGITCDYSIVDGELVKAETPQNEDGEDG